MDIITTKLPGLTYQTPVSSNDLEYVDDILNEAILIRLQLIMAFNNFGIVDSNNPREEITDTIRPLDVIVSENNSTQLTVNPGTAVTQEGHIVNLSSPFTNIDIANSEDGVINICYIEYLIEDGDNTNLSLQNTVVPVKRVQVVDPNRIIKVVTLDTYMDSNVYSSDRKKNIVVLAAITPKMYMINDIQSSYTLDIDKTNEVFEFNRPWFSPTDVEHRSRIGTGELTEQNPHALGLNELSSGNLTIYRQLLNTGIIISKDISISGVPGALCYEEVSATRIKRDVTGEITADSVLTNPGAFYVELNSYPNVIGSVVDINGNDLSVDLIEGTNIIVFGYENKPDDFEIEYFETKAIQPPLVPSTYMVFQTPVENEVVVSEGIESETTNLNISLGNNGTIAKEFNILYNAIGTMEANPSVIVPTTKIQNIDEEQLLDLDFNIGSKIIIGLTEATSTGTVNLKIKIYGVNIDDEYISETLVFDETWEDQVVPAAFENPNQFVQSETIFKSISNWEIIENDNTSNTASIIMYAHVEGALDERLLVAKLYWDGKKPTDLKDIRKIDFVARQFVAKRTAIQEVGEGIIASSDITELINRDENDKPSFHLISEDFRMPRYLDTKTIDWVKFDDGLDVSIIPISIRSSDNYRKIYRSRSISLHRYNVTTRIVVVLHGSNAGINEYGSVRLKVKNQEEEKEAIAIPLKGSPNNSTFVAYFEGVYEEIQFIVSGRAVGLTALLIQPSYIDPDYDVTSQFEE